MRAKTLVSSAVVVMMLLQPASAALATEEGPGEFGCKITTLRLSGGTTGTIEEGVVNEPNTPCVDDSFSRSGLSVSAYTSGLIKQSLEFYSTQAIAETDVEPRSTTASLAVTDLSLDYSDMNRVADMTTEIDSEAILFSVGADCVDNPQGKPTAQHPTFEATIGNIHVDGELVFSSSTIRGESRNLTEAGVSIPIEGVGTLHLLESNEVDSDPGHKNEEINLTVLRLETPEFNLELGEMIADFSNQPCAPGQTK